jgi:hypothetical protein
MLLILEKVWMAAEAALEQAACRLDEAKEEYEQAKAECSALSDYLASRDKTTSETTPCNGHELDGSARTTGASALIFPGTRASIRQALAEKPEGINLRDVESFIANKYPSSVERPTRKQLSLALSRMHLKTKELRIVHHAYGNSPAVYAIAENNGQNGESH